MLAILFPRYLAALYKNGDIELPAALAEDLPPSAKRARTEVRMLPLRRGDGRCGGALLPGRVALPGQQLLDFGRLELLSQELTAFFFFFFPR